MSPTEEPEYVDPTIREAPDAEPLDGRDSQAVAEGSSDDPETLEAQDPLRDSEAMRLGGDGLHTDPLPGDETYTGAADADVAAGLEPGAEAGAGEEEGAAGDEEAGPVEAPADGPPPTRHGAAGLHDGSGDDRHPSPEDGDENRFDAG